MIKSQHENVWEEIYLSDLKYQNQIESRFKNNPGRHGMRNEVPIQSVRGGCPPVAVLVDCCLACTIPSLHHYQDVDWDDKNEREIVTWKLQFNEYTQVYHANWRLLD